MARSRPTRLLGTALAFLIVLCLSAIAASADVRTPPPKATTKTVSDTAPVLTPEELAAQTILQRLKVEAEVREQERRFLASQYVQAGKDKLDMGDFKGSLRDFAKAAAYDPANRDALDGLKRARGILGIQAGVPGEILEQYANDRSVALAAARLDLFTHYAEAKALFDKGQYRDAIDALGRVEAQAKYLSPLLDVAPLGDEVATYLLRAKTLLDAQRAREQNDRILKAKTESDKLRQDRDKGTKDRSQVLEQQTASLLEQHRYDEARKAADALLRTDPGNAAAKRMYETAAESARNQAIDIALRKREVEMQRHWREIAAMMVPQSALVYMPPELFESVRNRKAKVILEGKAENPPEWEAKVRETLSKKVSFDFVETPLPDVLSFLSSLSGTTIVLDQAAIKDQQQPQISLRVSDMRLEAALSWICRLAGLAYGLKNEAVFVSTPNAIHDTPRLRMYDITDLTLDIPNFAGNRRALATSEGQGTQGQQGGWAQGFFDKADEAKEQEHLTPQALVDLIRRLISPGKWIEEEQGLRGHDEQAAQNADRERLTGEGLADVISITVGGRTFVGIKDKE